MGDRSKFNELKERFESMKDWSPVAAAALGYLIAKDELDAAEEEEEAAAEFAAEDDAPPSLTSVALRRM